MGTIKTETCAHREAVFISPEPKDLKWCPECGALRFWHDAGWTHPGYRTVKKASLISLKAEVIRNDQ